MCKIALHCCVSNARVATWTHHNITLFVNCLSCSTLDSEWLDLLHGKELLITHTTGLASLWHACPKWHAESFPRHALFNAAPFFKFLCPTSVCISRTCWCIYTFLTAYKLYMYDRCCQIKLPVQHFYTNQERCDVLTGNLSLGRRSGGDWANTSLWKKRFTSFETGSSCSSPSYFQIFFLIALLEEAFIRNIIILLWINGNL